jgi:hypothetical protein
MSSSSRRSSSRSLSKEALGGALEALGGVLTVLLGTLGQALQAN